MWKESTKTNFYFNKLIKFKKNFLRAPMHPNHGWITCQQYFIVRQQVLRVLREKNIMFQELLI